MGLNTPYNPFETNQNLADLADKTAMLVSTTAVSVAEANANAQALATLLSGVITTLQNLSLYLTPDPNTAGIKTNTAAIATSAAAEATSDASIATSTASIVTNTATLVAGLASIISNLASVSTNTSGISSIATNTGSDATNTGALVSRQSSSSVTTTGTNVLLVSVVIAVANPNRKGFIIFNNSANSGYITLGPTSVASTCTRLIATFTSWEFATGCVWTGPISAIRNSGSGVMTVFEFV